MAEFGLRYSGRIAEVCLAGNNRVHLGNVGENVFTNEKYEEVITVTPSKMLLNSITH